MNNNIQKIVKNYTNNPHFRKIKDSNHKEISSHVSLADQFNCHNFLTKTSLNCSIFNEQILRTNMKYIKASNKSPLPITILINNKAIANIPTGKTLLLDRSDIHTPIEVGDLISAIGDDNSNNVLFSLYIEKEQHEYNLDIGLAQLVLKDGHATTDMIVNNYFNIPFKFLYGENYIGQIKPSSRTRIEVYKQGFKEGSTISFISDNSRQYNLVIPEIPYGKHFELFIGSAVNFK